MSATSPVQPVKPILKWVGGKTQIIDEVLTAFPATIAGDYYEPFLGGGSVLLALLSYVRAGRIRVAGRVYASDANANLIAFYKNIQRDPAGLIAAAQELAAEFVACKGTVVNRKAATAAEAATSPESYYFWIRARFNALPAAERTSVAASAMLLFLNKTCFRGIYREGPRGFNVPFGNYKNPTIVDADHIMAVADLVRDVVFTHADFATPLTAVKSGDFVYMDPPYAPETDTSFVGYTADGFGADVHAALFAACAGMRGRGVDFVMSNAAVKMVVDAFPAPAYDTKRIVCRRAINSKKPDATATEVLITNRLATQAVEATP
jgi:DNA adenine methylase